MGRNKDLRKAIAGQKRVIERHEAKIRAERMKARPHEQSIAGWRREIEAANSRIAKLIRRLKRGW